MVGIGIYGAVELAALVWGVLWPRVAIARLAPGGLLISLVAAGLDVALLVNIGRGRRWARTILAALVCGSLCVVLLDVLTPGGHFLNLRWSLATLPLQIAAVVLLFLPSSRGWFGTENPAPSAPEGWHPDPLGRHDQRFWDGTLWTLQVADGQRVRWDFGSLERLWGPYSRAWFAFRDPAAAPTDWYADPRGRHGLRYWDGDRWTARVADGGRMMIEDASPREGESRWAR